MQQENKSSRGIRLLIVSLTLLIVGCVDDIPIILRDRLAKMTEKVDIVMHVVDQPSAKVYMKGLNCWEKRFRDEFDKLDERQRKVEDNMQNSDKKLLKEWNDYWKYMKECIKDKKYPKEDDWKPAMPQAYFRYTTEMVALEKSLDREKERLGKVLGELRAEPGAQEKDYAEVKALLDNLSGAKK